MRRLALLAAIVAALSTTATAGTRATYSMPGEPRKMLVVEAADNGDARAGPVDSGDYLLMVGGNAYMVQSKDGKTQVARVADMAGAIDHVMPPIFKQLFSAAAGGTPATKLAIARLGPQTVAGVAGTAYAINGLDENDPAKAETFVMSSDPSLAPVGRAISKFIESTLVIMSGLIGAASAEMIAQNRQIAALGTLLSGADGPRLEKLEPGVTVDPARLTLPAPPMTPDALAAELKASMRPAP